MSQLNTAFDTVRTLFLSYWNTPSKWKKYLFRTTTLYSSFLLLRYIYLNIRHKYILKLPPGPIGIFPLLNAIPSMIFYGAENYHKFGLAELYGPISSYSIFFATLIYINDPIIANKLYKGANKVNTTKHHSALPHPKGWHESNKNRNMFGHNYKVVKSIRRLISHESLTYKFMDKGIYEAMNKLIFTNIDKNKNIPIDVKSFTKPVHFSILLYTVTGNTIPRHFVYIYYAMHILYFISHFLCIKYVTGLSLEAVDDPVWTSFFKVQHLSSKKLTEKAAPVLLFGKSPPKSDGMIDLKDETQLYSSLYPMCEWTEDFVDKNSKIILSNPNAFFTKLFNENFNNNSFDEPKDKTYTKNELIFDIVSIFNAAIDTVNASIHSLLLNICRYQSIQESIYNELSAIFVKGEYDIKILQDELRKNERLNDFQAFIHEILRLFPPAFTTFPRVAQADIMVNGYCIPKGYYFGINSIGINYNRKYWGDEEKGIECDQVYLQNFKDENGRFKRANNNLFTFGAGPRMCPGMQFAVKELYLLMAHFIWRYKMTFDPDDVNVKGKNAEDVVLKEGQGDDALLVPKPNIKVLFTKRDR